MNEETTNKNIFFKEIYSVTGWLAISAIALTSYALISFSIIVQAKIY